MFQELGHRRSIRLRSHDYRDGGIYFVTICTKNKECIFGEIRNGMMGLSDEGSVVAECWSQIPQHFRGVELDEWIIMPNHIHGLIYMDDPRYRGVACNAPTEISIDDLEHKKLTGPPLGSLGILVRSFKSAVTKRINELRREPGSVVWQRNYYEHIVRSEEETLRIRRYIMDNPSHWMIDDEYFPSDK
jgi:REP element-mobilizing transposase RayT